MGLTLEKVIEKLTALNVPFDPNGKYNDLRKLLKNSTPEPEPVDAPPDVLEFDSKLQATFLHVSRVQHDEMN